MKLKSAILLWLTIGVSLLALGTIMDIRWLRFLGSVLLLPPMAVVVLIGPILLISRITGWPWGSVKNRRESIDEETSE